MTTSVLGKSLPDYSIFESGDPLLQSILASRIELKEAITALKVTSDEHIVSIAKSREIARDQRENATQFESEIPKKNAKIQRLHLEFKTLQEDAKGLVTRVSDRALSGIARAANALGFAVPAICENTNEKTQALLAGKLNGLR